jgi:hypothetical protein
MTNMCQRPGDELVGIYPLYRKTIFIVISQKKPKIKLSRLI